MDKNVETWIKLLFTYGPFALLALFVFVIEYRARRALRESPQNTKLFTVVYSFVWAVILSLAIFTTWVWYKINVLPDEYTIAGTFENLSGSEKIVHRKADQNLYLCRRYHDMGYFSEQWRLVTGKKLEDGTRVHFSFDRGPTGESKENVREYELIVRKEFYEENLEIRYDRNKNKLMLSCGGITEEILPIDQTPPDGHARKHGFLIGIAHAGEPLVPAEFIKRLESDDPIIRRDARMELGRLGEKALPLVQTALLNPNSSYRQKLGFIAALGNMKEVEPTSLSQSTINAIIEASADKDAALRGAALRFFGKHPSQELNAQVQQAMSKAKAEAASPERISRLARAQCEIFYNLGVREKDAYAAKHDFNHFQTGVKYFQDAWELNTLSVPDDQIYFFKPLYGWGLILHSRSYLERLPNGEKKPDLVQAAQNKFMEFLQAFEKASHKEKYPYPEHERRAKAYLENPATESLRK